MNSNPNFEFVGSGCAQQSNAIITTDECFQLY